MTPSFGAKSVANVINETIATGSRPWLQNDIVSQLVASRSEARSLFAVHVRVTGTRFRVYLAANRRHREPELRSSGNLKPRA